MKENKPIQWSLFPIGQGANVVPLLKDKTTRALLTEAELINNKCQHAYLDYRRFEAQKETIAQELKNSIGRKTVLHDGDHMKRDQLLAINRFLKNYWSEQCGRVERLRELIRELNNRGADIQTIGEVFNMENC